MRAALDAMAACRAFVWHYVNCPANARLATAYDLAAEGLRERLKSATTHPTDAG